MTIRTVQYQAHVKPIPPQDAAIATPTGWNDFCAPPAKANKLTAAEQFAEDAAPARPAVVVVDGYEAVALNPLARLAAKLLTQTRGAVTVADTSGNTVGWEPVFPALTVPIRRRAAREEATPHRAADFIALAWVDTPAIRVILRPLVAGLADLAIPAAAAPSAFATYPDARPARNALSGAPADLPTAAVSTPSAFASFPDGAGRRAAPRPAQQDHAVQQVPTEFVANGWASIWEPTRNPLRSSLQRDNDPVLGAYATVVIVYPDGWQATSFEPVRRAKALRPAKGEAIFSAAVAATSGWEPMAAPAGKRAARPAGGAEPAVLTPAPAILLVDYGFPAPVRPRVRLSAPADLPLAPPVFLAWPGDLAAPPRRARPAPVASLDPLAPTAFAQMGWGTQYPDGLRRPRKTAPEGGLLARGLGASLAPVFDFGYVTTKPKRAPVGPADAGLGKLVVAAPGNTALWSVDSQHIRRIVGFPEYNFAGFVRVGFAIVSTPTLLGTKQAPSIYGAEAQALLDGVDAQAALDGAKAAPTLLGTRQEPDLEGDV